MQYLEELAHPGLAVAYAGHGHVLWPSDHAPGHVRVQRIHQGLHVATPESGINVLYQFQIGLAHDVLHWVERGHPIARQAAPHEEDSLGEITKPVFDRKQRGAAARLHADLGVDALRVIIDGLWRDAKRACGLLH